MPDGDCIYWRLRGPGSRKFIDVVRSGADAETVGDLAEAMVAKHVEQKGLRDFLPEMAETMYDALASAMVRGTDFERLRWSLQDCAARRNNDEAFIAARAGERVFTRLESKGCPIALAEVQTAFFSAVASDMVQQHALNPSRGTLMQESGRSTFEQLEWEKRRLQDLEQRVRPWGEAVFDGSNRKIRIRRRSAKRKMTLEEMHEPL